ncbi:putative membrane protein [Geobacillus sp. PA-3]|jgi:dTDP-4-amino-4,6-dideoxygalactose transaminase|nr:putative membrane protein [Geobacillus sp. PA-3]
MIKDDYKESTGFCAAFFNFWVGACYVLITYYPHQEGWSVSDELFANGICLPSGSSMTVEEQNRVIDVFIKALKR